MVYEEKRGQNECIICIRFKKYAIIMQRPKKSEISYGFFA